MTDDHPDFDTMAIHAGTRTKADFQSTSPAIHPSTTYVYDDVAEMHAALAPESKGFVYSRNANPTVGQAEEAVAALEESEDAVAFASGMAAIHGAVLGTGIRQGQSVLAATHLYGGSRSLLSSFFQRLGFPLRLISIDELDLVERELREADVGALLFEPVSNPLITVADTPALIELSHALGVPVIVDNTFTSPYLFTPATVGADFVVESATKYLGGHGDVMAGFVACSSERATALRAIRTATGGILGPFEAWLVLRGIRTLALRMPRQCENADALSMWLSERSDITAVHYPGLEKDPGHLLATRLFRDGLGGGMLSFETHFDAPRANAFLNALRVAVPGPSLGDVATLVLHPVQASHRSLSAQERAELGITDGLLRVSAGLESAKDLIADFAAAFDAVYTPIA